MGESKVFVRLFWRRAVDNYLTLVLKADKVMSVGQCLRHFQQEIFGQLFYGAGRGVVPPTVE
jgi:hypothetical protein